MRQKRFLSWLLTLCLLLGMFSFPAYAEGNTTTISGDGTADKTGTMTITLVIPKKTPAATDLTYTAPSELTYSGSDKDATVAAASGVTGLGNITVKYYSDASRTTEAAPKNVGTYYVGATVAEGDQYAASTGVLYGDGWTFTITASTPSTPAAPTKASATKNSITLNAVDGCEYSKDGKNWQSGTEFTGLNPGTEYTFYQRVKATANTNASNASSASFTTEADTYAMTITLVIKPAQTITAENVTATYGDTDKSVSASVTEPTTGGGSISYAVKEGSGDYISVNESTGALTIKKVPPTDGKAYVVVTAAETETHAATTKDVTVTINQKELTIKAKDQSIYVNGTVPDLSKPVVDTHYTVTGLVGQDALTNAPTLDYKKDGNVADPDNSKADTYDIVPSNATANDNYTIRYENGKLTISQKPSGGGDGSSVDPVKQVIDKIDALSEPYDEAKVKEAREAFEKLDKVQKEDPRLTADVMKKLTDAEEAIESGKAQKAAGEVSEMIAALADPSKASTDQVAAAVAAYKALSDKAKVLITEAERKTLQVAVDYPAASKKAALKSVKAKKGRKAVAKWKKKSAVNGYQLVYSTSRKFKKKATKKVSIKSYKTVKKTVKKLKKGKKYYFKIRTYTKVENISTGKTRNVYGKWSKVKKIKAR